MPHVSAPAPSSSLPPCPGSASVGRVATHSYLPLVIGVTLKDAAGRVFDAADTVAVDWKLSDTPLAGLAAPNGVVSQPVKREDYLEPGKPHQVLEVVRVGRFILSSS